MFFKVRYGFSKNLILIKRVKKKLTIIKKKHEVHSAIHFPKKIDSMACGLQRDHPPALELRFENLFENPYAN